MPPPARLDAQTGIVLDSAGVTVMGKTILQDLTLHLTERRIGIVGRNGSGKTTMLRLMAGLIAPTAGVVRVDGTDPTTDRRAMLRQMGILFQNPDHQILFPTVAEELAFGLRQMGQPDDEVLSSVHALLAAEGRSHWADAATHTLSHGQRHYLCLLAVLLMQPATILLDEPLSGLDLPTRARLARRFAALPQRLITISHDPRSMAGCDRVIWIDAGRVVADGAAGPVLADFTAAMEQAGVHDADTDLAL